MSRAIRTVLCCAGLALGCEAEDAAAPVADSAVPTDVSSDTPAAPLEDSEASEADAAPSTDAPPTEAPDVAPPSGPTADDVKKLGAHGVGRRTVTFVDTSRPTQPNGDFPGAAERTLVTDVYYPSTADSTEGAIDDAAVEPGPWPLAVFGHGYLSGRNEDVPLFTYLASHGIVVAIPTFPLTNTNAPGGATLADTANQPGDVRFVIDSVEGLSKEPGWFSGALADPLPVALAGMSLGGLTVTLASTHAEYRDPRVLAFAAMAAPLCLFPAASYADDAPPALLVYGTLDRVAPYAYNGRKALERMKGPRRLVTIDGGSHLGFAAVGAEIFAQLEDPDSIGCNALKTNLGGKKLRDIATRIGFADELDATDICPEPCSDPGEVVAMKTTDQNELVILSVGAFLRRHLTGAAELDGFLDHQLALDRSTVTVEIGAD